MYHGESSHGVYLELYANSVALLAARKGKVLNPDPDTDFPLRLYGLRRPSEPNEGGERS